MDGERKLTKSFLDLTWRIVYIGQANDSGHDQILEEAEMDDIQPGQMKFVFEVCV
jgi:ASF1 like histone chaperone